MIENWVVTVYMLSLDGKRKKEFTHSYDTIEKAFRYMTLFKANRGYEIETMTVEKELKFL